MTDYHPKMDSLKVGELYLLADKFPSYNAETRWYRGVLYQVSRPMAQASELNSVREFAPSIGTMVILVQKHVDMNPDYDDVLRLLGRKGYLGRRQVVEVLYGEEKCLTSAEFLWNDADDVKSITSLPVCNKDTKDIATVHYVWASLNEESSK